MKKLSLSLALYALACLSAANIGFICRLMPGVDPQTIAQRYGITLADTTAGAPFAFYSALSSTDAHDLEDMMEADPDIVWAEDDSGLASPEPQGASTTRSKGSTLPAIGDRNVLYAANLNMLAQIDWDQSITLRPGRTVRVAIIDTGLSPLQWSLWAKVDASANFVEPGLKPYDIPRQEDSNGNGIMDEMMGHGTMIAGIIDQISPSSRLVIARVADSDGNATAWTVIKGLAFAVTSGAEVANISLGTLDQVPALSEVIDWTESKGLLVVSAIGNDGVGRSDFPARYSKVLCVSGLNPDNTKATFSNWSKTSDASAPATGILSQAADGRIGLWSGTSFAAPMASATAAEALRLLPGPLSPSALRGGFKRFGRDLDLLNPNFHGQLGVLLDFSRYVKGLTQPKI